MTTITPSNEKDVPVVPLHIELRDYFAAKALVGLLAQSNGTAMTSTPAVGASFAYEMADAMLKAREVKNV